MSAGRIARASREEKNRYSAVCSKKETTSAEKKVELAGSHRRGRRKKDREKIFSGSKDGRAVNGGRYTCRGSRTRSCRVERERLERRGASLFARR